MSEAVKQGAAHRGRPRRVAPQRGPVIQAARSAPATGPRPRGPGGAPDQPIISELIGAEALRRLETISGLAFVDRNNPEKLEDIEVPAAILYDGEEEPAAEHSGVTGVTQRFEVRVLAEAQEWREVSFVCNGLVGLVVRAMLRKLDQDRWLALDVSAIAWDGTSDLLTPESRGGRPRGERTVQFVVLRSEAEGDPFNLESEGV